MACKVASAVTLQWDASGSTATAPFDGAGNWDLSETNWSNGSVDSIWPDDGTIAVFGRAAGVAGAIDVTTPITAGGLVFNPATSGNYNLAGSSLTLGAGTINVNNSNPSIASSIGGSNGLTLSGDGSLTLLGSNNYQGTTNVSSGTLIAAAPGAIAGGDLNLGSSGAVLFNSSTTLNGNVSSTGTIDVATGQTVNLIGASSTFYASAGTLNINGALNFSGAHCSFGGTVNGTVTLTGATPSLGVAGLGTFVINNSGSQSSLNVYTIGSGPSVIFQPTGSSNLNLSSSNYDLYGNLTLLSADGHSNTLSVTSQFLFLYGTCTIAATGTPSGPTNMSGGEMETQVGSTLNFNTSTVVSSYLYTQGTVNIAAGQTLSLGTGNNRFNQGGGTLNIYGVLNVPSYVGTGQVNGLITLVGPSTSVGFYSNTEPITGTYLISTNGSSGTLETDLPPGGLVIFEPLVNSTLISNYTVGNNGGTLELLATNGLTVGLTTNLNNSGSFITAATGTPLKAIAITGTFNNQTGAVAAFNTSTSISGLTVNSGNLNIAIGQTLSMAGFNNAAGTVNVAGMLLDTSSFTDSGTINYLANNSGSIFQRSTGFFLNLSLGAVVNVGASANSSSRQLVVASKGLSLSGTSNKWSALFNLNNNDLDLAGGNLMNVSNQAKEGFNGGNWNGAAGILSTSAGNDAAHLTALGVIQNNQSGAALFTASNPFDGITPGVSDILIKYTYYGDSNLDGKVDGSDYSLIDSGFLSHRTGWLNGDFNYDGVVNGSDYTLIDNAFNQQGAQLSALTADQQSQSTVPEPGLTGVMMLSAFGIVGRRNRRRVAV